MMLKHAPKILLPFIGFRAIQQYAAHSYLYYVEGKSVVEDHEFDELCRWMLENYDWIKPMDLNGYIDKDALAAGTGYNIAEKVCGQTRDYALSLLKNPLPVPKKKAKPAAFEDDIEDLL